VFNGRGISVAANVRQALADQTSVSFHFMELRLYCIVTFEAHYIIYIYMIYIHACIFKC
jgi:hypothetical protein